MRLLLVEAEEGIGKFICQGLREAERKKRANEQHRSWSFPQEYPYTRIQGYSLLTIS